MLVRKAYERLGLADRTLRTATFQAATFASRRQAEAALARGVTWTESYTDERLEDIPEWNPWAWTLPPGQPTVVGRKEDWAVIRVSNRNAKPVSWDRHRDELTRELAPRVREFEAVRALRKDANIRVDTTLFFEIQPPLPP